MEQHKLDQYLITKDESPLYVNEPWLIDKQLLELPLRAEPDDCKDNVRIYIPMDLNKEAILRRLDGIIYHYGEVNEENEYQFSVDVAELISQLEIYDQVWHERHMPDGRAHSIEGIDLAKEFVAKLEQIPDGCSECFPFDVIEELKGEYLSS